ncbi:outer membrane beta-barrel protein [Chitinophaga sp.]|uniref:outer membrane beta-barrel protein n=1 Tax=Chitinophaga sp. TaxID=1869181 RepID=UPI0031D9912C
MKRLFLISYIIAICSPAVAQVSGKLQDVQGAPVPFANVILLKAADSSIFKGAVADEQGSFQIADVPVGQYVLRVNAIGYEVLHIPLNGAKNIGVQVLQTSRRQLGEVVVRGTKPLYQQQEQGMVVNVESSILSKGSAALEVLERAPGIIIDHRNNSISMNGKSGVMVMLNGKLLRMPVTQVVELLRGMRADDVEKIELLTTPGVSYDAEGDGGIINIVLKKNSSIGLNGSVSATAGYGWGEKAGTSVQMGYNKWYGSYSYNHNRSNADWHAVGTAQEPLYGGLTYSDVTGVMQPVENSHTARVGFDSRHMGASLLYGYSHTHFHNINSGMFNVLPDSILYNHVDVNEYMKWKNMIADFYVEGKHLNLSLDYLRYTMDRPSKALNSFVNLKGEEIGNNDTLFAPVQEGYAHTLIQVGVMTLDYKKQLNDKLKFEAGVKGSYNRTQSASGIKSLVEGEYVTGKDAADDGVMREVIGAGYASLKWQMDSATALTVGSRYEYADTRLTTERKMGKLFPAIAFNKSFPGGHELFLTYNKRITRPAYTDLASFKSYTGPNSYASGNPSLIPTITNIFKIGYNYKGYSFSLLASRDDHPIVRWQMTETPDSTVLIVSSQNMLWQNNLVFQASIPVQVTDWWSMNYSLLAAYRQFKLVYTRKPAEKGYFTGSLNFSEQFKFQKGWSGELSGFYWGPSYDGSKKVGSFWEANVGVKKEIGKGTLQFAVEDILANMHIPFSFGKLTEEAHDLKTNVVYSAESSYFPVMKLTYFRAFGGGKQSHKESGAKEERERIN